LTPQNALTKVISSAGASLPARSHVDAFMIDELLSYGTNGKLIVHERENEIYNYIGVISGGTKPLDTDNDGIPDAWEDQNGLNKNNASDAVALASNGYLNIENYINSISGPVAPYVRCASNLKMTARTKSSIQLSWKNNALESDQIQIQQSTNGTTFTTIATISGSLTSYNIMNLELEKTYYYRLVTTKSGLSNSTPSEILKTATEGEPKAPYQSHTPLPEVGGTSRSYTSVDFSWANETGPWAGDVTYDVYVGATSGNLTKVASGLTDKAYTYSTGNLAMSNTYYWRVDGTNTLGTVPGAVWNFTTGTYSFVSSTVDIGRDYDGTTPTTAASGVTLTSTKSYTIKSGTSDEFVFSGSGTNVMNTNSSNGVYQKSGNYPFFYLSDDSYYIQGTLTSVSADKNMASLKVNGTSATLDAGAKVYVLFSDAINFNTGSVIGYEEAELPECRNGNSGVTISTPVGSKSFRIYRKVTISTIGEDLYKIGSGTNTETLTGSGSPRIAYVSATLELLSNDDTTVLDGPTIGILTANGSAASYDNLLLSAFGEYNVKFLNASGTTPSDINAYYKDYDLIVLHASVSGTNAIALATQAMVGVKPILNLKAYFYNNGRWNWSTPSNTEIGRVHSNVDASMQSHPIFANVTFDANKLVLFSEPTTVINAFQYVIPMNGTSWTSQMSAANTVLATIDGDASKIHMHELNLNESAKYLLIGLSNEGDSYARFNSNAVTLLSNAASYLLSPVSTRATAGIDNNNASSNIKYLGKSISNPDKESITIPVVHLSYYGFYVVNISII